MKARRVKKLDPQAPLADNLQRIVETRLDELCSFMPVAADPRRVTELHDMRIAAKRLRYILEVADGVFGPYAKQAGKRTKELQDLLGEIHDCDVTTPRIEALMSQASGDSEAQAGLAAMIGTLAARRALLFASFGRMWLGLEREGFRARLAYAVTERACSHDVNGTRAAPTLGSP